MESIIASQKIGKRRSAAKPRYRPAADSRPYVPLLEDRLPARRTGRGHGGHTSAGLRAPIARIASAIRFPPRLDLRVRLRPFAARASRLPKARLALVGLGLIAVSVIAAFGIAAIVRGPAFPLPKTGLLPATDGAQEDLLEYLSPELADGKADSGQDGSSLPPAPVTLDMSTYTVRAGDSLASVAKRFGLNVDTIISANGVSSSSALRSGAQLRIPNLDGLIYRVRSGDKLSGVAKRFKVETTRIVDANDLGTAQLKIGQSLFIPGARLPKAVVSQALGPKVAWPVRGPLSSYFGYRPDPFTGVRRFHAGLDIVVDAGTLVKAAMAGRVSDVGYNANYGNYIIIDHGNGFQTLYGHLSSASVADGAVVAQGSVIGLSGNTGYSTGAHLHFGLFKRSLALNPLKYLK